MQIGVTHARLHQKHYHGRGDRKLYSEPLQEFSDSSTELGISAAAIDNRAATRQRENPAAKLAVTSWDNALYSTRTEARHAPTEPRAAGLQLMTPRLLPSTATTGLMYGRLTTSSVLFKAVTRP